MATLEAKKSIKMKQWVLIKYQSKAKDQKMF